MNGWIRKMPHGWWLGVALWRNGNLHLRAPSTCRNEKTQLIIPMFGRNIFTMKSPSGPGGPCNPNDLAKNHEQSTQKITVVNCWIRHFSLGITRILLGKLDPSPVPSPVLDRTNPSGIQGGAPPVMSVGLYSPLTIDISPINQSYWSYRPT